MMREGLAKTRQPLKLTSKYSEGFANAVYKKKLNFTFITVHSSTPLGTMVPSALSLLCSILVFITVDGSSLREYQFLYEIFSSTRNIN